MVRYSALLFFLPLAAAAQLDLQGFDYLDTVSVPCVNDSSQTLLSFMHWEAYQTLDNTWNGPRDTTDCIELPYGTGFSIHARIDFDQLDRTRPVFLRYQLDSASAIPLSSNDIYSISMDAYLGPGTTLDSGGVCADGLCNGLLVGVRVPDSAGAGSVQRWYQSSFNTSGFSPPMHICVPTEKFVSNALRELIAKFTPGSTALGQYIDLYGIDPHDRGYEGLLLGLDQTSLLNYQSAPAQYTLDDWNMDHLVLYTDTTYPESAHVSYLDIGPVPNQPVQTNTTLTLGSGIGFMFQPFTQLRGGLVLGSDTLRHPLTVVNDGAELCLSWMIAELIWGTGQRYVHRAGLLDFEGERSCFLFQPGSTLEVAEGSILNYGGGGRGILALRSGCAVEIQPHAELVIHHAMDIRERPGATVAEKVLVRLGPDSKLTFAPGSWIHNWNSIDHAMKLTVILDGGRLDITGLSPEDRQKIEIIELPADQMDPLVVKGNPVDKAITFDLLLRSEGKLTVRAFDELGRPVIDQVRGTDVGENRFEIPVADLAQGAYVLRVEQAGQVRVARFIKL